MSDPDEWARRFEAHRGHLRAVAYRMLGSTGEADDAVQEAWLRLARVDPAEVDNLGGWLTRVVGRICLDMLRARAHRREEPWDEAHEKAPLAEPGPQDEAVHADEVGLALLVVLDGMPGIAIAQRGRVVLTMAFTMRGDRITAIDIKAAP